MTRASRRALHLLLALAIGGSCFDAHAHQRTAPGEAFYERLAAGEKAAAAGDLENAGRAYEQAYEALPAADRGTDTGTDVVLESVRARRELFLQDPDTSVHLQAAEVLLASHIANLKAADPARTTTDLDKQLDAIRKLLAKIEKPPDEAKPEPEPVAIVSPSPSDLPPPEPTSRDRSPPSKRVGIALAASGGVAVVGGVVLIAIGANFYKKNDALYPAAKREEYPTDCSAAPFSVCDYDAKREGLLKKDRAAIGVGAALAVVGVAGVIAGAVIVKKSKADKRAAFAPMHLRHGAGLQVAVRF